MASAFNRLNYDVNTYQFDVQQSVGPGAYALGTPTPHCMPCFSSDTRQAMGTTGGADCADRPLVDVDSELHGLTRRATNCPTGKYSPGQGACCLRPYPDCAASATRTMPHEDTRLSNPPCTLRGTGWNRWQWLCQDPQERALVPFDFNIDNRLVVKDNHRPHLATPLDARPVLPGLVEDTQSIHQGWMPANAGLECAVAKSMPPEPPQLHWRSCGELNTVRYGAAAAASRAAA
jgi:hypothetical protein